MEISSQCRMNETKEWNLWAVSPLLQHGTEENPVTVIVVSNRVARARPDEPVAGGLAAALIPMVKESGAIWVGSSGQTADMAQRKDSFAKIEALGTGALATVDMPAKHYAGFYEGFANSALWPALHSRADLIQV